MIKTENYVREVIIIFFAQKKLIVGTWFLVAAFAVCVAFFWPPVYEVKGSILVKNKKVEKNPETLEDTELKIFEVRKRDLLAEIEILSSPDVIGATVKSMALENRYFTEKDLEENALKKAIRGIQGNLGLSDVPDSNIVEARLRAKDPQRALAILETLMNEYLAYRSSIYNPEQSVMFFETQTEKFNSALHDNEAMLEAVAVRYNSVDPVKEIENNLALKKELENQLDLNKIELGEKKKNIAYLQAQLVSMDFNFFTNIDNDSIRQLGEKLQALYVERGVIMRIYHGESEKVEAVTEQMDDVYRSLKNEVDSYLKNLVKEAEILDMTVAGIENRLAQISRRNLELYACRIESERIRRQMDLLSYSYETFKKRLEEARINTGSVTDNLFSISILSKPYFSGSPVFPSPSTLVPVGVLAGFFLSMTLGYLNEFFDHTFKRPEDSDKFAGLPNIFSIPDWSVKK